MLSCLPNALNLAQKLWISRTAQQRQASFHLASVRHADQGARDVRVAQAEAQGDLRYIRSMTAAKLSSLLSRIAHGLRRRVPIRRPLLGQNPHVQSRRVDEPDPTLPREGGQDFIHIRVQEAVVAVRKDAVDRRSLGNAP